MRLTRRDALSVLAGLGVVGGATAVGLRARDAPEAGELTDTTVRTLVAAAEVLYPSSVEGHADFVETYVVGRTSGRPTYREGMADAVEAVDEAAEAWYGDRYAALDRETRESVLRELGADTAEPVREGTTAEQVRFYVVNELLYAFYSSPAGGELVGIENPVGHPGGIESYQRGPDG